MTPSTWLVLKDSKLCPLPENFNTLNDQEKAAAIESAPEVSNPEVLIFKAGEYWFHQPHANLQSSTKGASKITDRVPLEVRGWTINASKGLIIVHLRKDLEDVRKVCFDLGRVIEWSKNTPPFYSIDDKNDSQ